MDRWILAFWIFVGGLGLFHATHHVKAAPGTGSVQAMDGGIFPPVSR